MLLELNIKDLAIIDSLSISLGPGFNVFTGETGAGKSIIIDAIDLILGDRATVDVIRSGKEEARVEALFDAARVKGIREILEESGIASAENLLISRVVAKSGRNKIFINGSLSTLMTLNEIGRRCIDIYGQSEHQSLTRPEEHVEILDSLGGTSAMRREMHDSYWKWAAAQKKLDEFVSGMKLSVEERGLIEAQVKEISDAALKEGEEEELKKERERLRNSERLSMAAGSAERDLYSDEHSILGRLRAVIKELKDVSKIDGRLEGTAKKIEAAFFELEDSSGFLRDYAASLDADPARLEEIEARLHTIEKLKKKYGPTVKEALQKKEAMDVRLAKVEDYDISLKTLKESAAMAREEAVMVAESLSESRRAKAVEFKMGVEKELSELGMKGCVFQVAIETDRNPDGSIRFGEKGAERVNFFIAANPGEGLKPLPRVASGGELSRIMLAIKGLTSMGRVSTLIFDEVDAGIGAVTAAVVGRKIKNVSKKHQVICVTHLPQVAAFADSHYHVEKVKTDDGRTVTRVKKLSAEERVEEIASMLAGAKVSDTTRKQAKEMLAASIK